MPSPTRILKAVHLELGSIASRGIALTDARRRAAYAGGQGVGNLGDDAIFGAAESVLGRVQLHRLVDDRRERRMRLLGLSGTRFFQSFILGGGTFINPQAERPVRLALELGLSCWAFGTGAGSSGFNQPYQADIGPWGALLSQFKAIGVRGPLSRERLEALGVGGAHVIGDLALAHARSALPEPSTGERRFCVNVLAGGAGHIDVFAESKLDGLDRAVRDLLARGWTPVLVAMDPSDVEPLQSLAARTGIQSPQVHLPRTVQRFFDLVEPCVFTVGVRLHSVVLSTCAGVPGLMLGYRDKCLDFMRSLELQDWHVDLETESGRIHERVLALADAAPRLRDAYFGGAHHYRRRILEFAERMLSEAV